MRVQFYMLGKELTHPVVNLFFKYSQKLSLLKYILPLMKWSQFVYQAANYRLTRDDCKTIVANKFFQTCKGVSEEVMKKHFKTFRESWDELRKDDNMCILRMFDASLPTLPQIHLNTVLHNMISENSEALIFKILNILVRIQNDFLDEILVITLTGNCSSVGFLKKGNLAVIKCNLLQNAKEDHIINCDNNEIQEDLSIFAQNNLNFGFGKQVCYNFVKIEMELANRLALGKTYLVLNNFPFITYANELFASCASVLQEFKSLIPQVPLGAAIKNGIEDRKKSNPEYIQEMMRHTEILLCFVKRIGGNQDQTLASYIQTWLKTLPGGLMVDLLPSGGEPLKLCHLVALYEFLENQQADIVIDSLDERFKKDLPPPVKKELLEFINCNHIPINSIQIAFRRFVMRYLVNFDTAPMDLNAPLVEWMTEPSLWPEGVKGNGELQVNKPDDPKQLSVKSEFPEMLNLEHTYQALDCINEELKVIIKC